MKVKLNLAILLTAVVFVSLQQSCQVNKTSEESVFESRADSILRLMNIEEKVGQLSLFSTDLNVTGPDIDTNYLQFIKDGKVGGVFNAFEVDFVEKLQRIAVEESRLGIPLFIAYDIIHGHRTIFPIPLAQASSWELDMIEKSERIAATEATAEGVNWIFSPNVDITRDPRWGRVMETAGEDTWLASQVAKARVNGFQGDDLARNNTVMACAKHFAAYGAPVAGREYNTVELSPHTLVENYLPSYKACVDAGVESFMTSFNDISGVPATCNEWLLKDVLRDQWGFEGVLVTDYSSVSELLAHGVAADSAEAGMLTINSGNEIDMQSSIYRKFLPDLIREGKVAEADIDKAVRRILVAKFKLGLMDDPYKYCNKQREQEEVLTDESLKFAREFVAKSCVLLKNEQVLPVSEEVKSIAVIGPLGNTQNEVIGPWRAAGNTNDAVTLLRGIQDAAGDNVEIIYEKGCNILNDSLNNIDKAVRLAKKSDLVILALGEKGESGEFGGTNKMSGEAASRSDIGLPGIQMELARAVIKANPNCAVVLFNGRPLTIVELDEMAPAILETWFGGIQAGNGIADVLFGKYNPSGKLTISFPRNVGQIPIYYNHENTGRPLEPGDLDALPGMVFRSRYIDVVNEPLYPFGYGLSYTTFEYSDIKMDKTELLMSDTLVASVKVTNTGEYDGEEIVQLYVRDLVGEVIRPLKELKGFEKVFIKKGETADVEFKLTRDDLRYYHIDFEYATDPGDFELYIGSSSAVVDTVAFTMK